MPVDRLRGQPFHILLSVLLALVPLADGSQPDPIWIEGVYDGEGDADVFLSFVLPGALLEGAQPRVLEPLLVVVGRLPARASTPPTVATLRAFRFRSPPIL